MDGKGSSDATCSASRSKKELILIFLGLYPLVDHKANPSTLEFP